MKATRRKVVVFVIALVLTAIIHAGVSEGARRARARSTRADSDTDSAAHESNSRPAVLNNKAHASSFRWTSDPSHLTGNDIVSHFSTFDFVESNANTRRNSGVSFAFITPWNPSGANHAEQLGGSGLLDMVAPVMYELHPGGSLTGESTYSDADFERWNKAGLKIVPRVLVNSAEWNADDFDSLFRVEARDVIEKITSEMTRRGAHGFVLEYIASYFGALMAAQSSGASPQAQFSLDLLLSFGAQVSQTARSNNLVAVTVCPSWTDSKIAHVASQLAKPFDYVVVMAYEPPHSRALAPANWVRQVAEFWTKELKLSNVLLGVNFFGAQYSSSGGRETVTADRILDVFRRPDIADTLHRRDHRAVFAWDESVQEHVLRVSGSELYFPTPHSLAVRINIAQESGCAGISIWDLGQGFPALFAAL